jgi:ABC-type multidrug transport system fused ATPase/permease subunit
VVIACPSSDVVISSTNVGAIVVTHPYHQISTVFQDPNLFNTIIESIRYQNEGVSDVEIPIAAKAHP